MSNVAFPYPSAPVIPAMPGLDRVATSLLAQNSRPFANLSFIVSQHLLPTVLPLFEWLFSAGAMPERVFVLAKIYSADLSVVAALRSRGTTVEVCPPDLPGFYDRALEQSAERLWAEAEDALFASEGVVVLDHGGFLRRTVPLAVRNRKPIVAIEHTTRGFYSPQALPIPCIDMARSWVKMKVESKIIARHAIEVLEQIVGGIAASTIGLIGVGTIGAAVAAHLRSLGASVSVYDPRSTAIAALGAVRQGITIASSAVDVCRKAQIIIGCSGRDSLSGLDWSAVHGGRICASLSSSDIEFCTILQGLPAGSNHVGRDIMIQRGEANIRLLSGGFPITFDPRGRDIAIPIEVTRALTFAALVQAAQLIRSGQIIPLDEKLQRLVMAGPLRQIENIVD